MLSFGVPQCPTKRERSEPSCVGGGVVVVVVVWCWCGGDVRVVLVVLLAVMVALVKISLSFSSCKQKVPSSLKYRLVGPV